MIEILDVAHQLLRWSHITMGFAGLVVFWIVVALPKGTTWHLRLGRTFAWLAMYVGGTAVISAGWALLHVESFAPWLARLPSGRAAEVREFFAYFFSILLFLGAATVCGANFGVNVMRYRHHHAILRRTWLPWLEIFLGLSAVWLVGFGCCKLAGIGGPPAGGLPWVAYQLPVILGVIGIWTTYIELRYILGPEPRGQEWLYRHVEQMFGTATAFHTAFAVFGFGRLAGFQLSGIWSLLPWIVTPAIGIAATHFYLRHLRKREFRWPTVARQADLAT